MLFSVVTITRNNLEGLKRTWESLRAQSYADYEWIVIDGLSDDQTRHFLPTTSADWISEEDDGIYDAMNKGLLRAQGDYIIFMNAGDEFASPEVLAQAAETIAQVQPDFLYGDALEDGNYKRARPYMKITQGMFTHHQSIFYHRESLAGMPYDINYKIAADYKFTALALSLADKISYLPFPICRFESGGISQQQARKGRQEKFQVRRELKLCPPLANVAIYAGQTILMNLRRMAPALYWRLKK